MLFSIFPNIAQALYSILRKLHISTSAVPPPLYSPRCKNNKNSSSKVNQRSSNDSSILPPNNYPKFDSISLTNRTKHPPKEADQFVPEPHSTGVHICAGNGAGRGESWKSSTGSVYRLRVAVDRGSKRVIQSHRDAGLSSTGVLHSVLSWMPFTMVT